jgi:transcriptional regulator with XRE-family HTH domain
LKNLFKAGYDASKLGALRVSLESLKRVKPPNVTPSMLAKQARITTDTFNKFYHYNVPLSLSASLRLRRLYPSLSLSNPAGATGHHLGMFHKANGLTEQFTALKLGIPEGELRRLERLESQKLPNKVSRAMARQRGILPSHLGPPMTAQEINAWMKAHPMNVSLLSMIFGLGPHSLRRISTSTKERTIDILSRKIHLLTSDVSKASSIGIVPAETMSGARFRFWRVIRGLDHAELAKGLNRTEEEIKRVERAGIEPIPWKKEVDHLSNKLPIKQLPPLTWSDVKFWRNARGITASHLMKRVGSARSLLNRELDGTAPADDFVVRWVMSRISATDAHVTGDELLSWRQKYHLDVPQAAMELQTSPEMIAYSEALGAAEIFPELASRMLSHPAVFQQKHSANADTLTGGQLARLLPFLNLTETQFIKIVGTSLRSAYHYENHPELPIPDSWVRRLRNWAQRVQEEDEKQSSTESAAKYFA